MATFVGAGSYRANNSLSAARYNPSSRSCSKLPPHKARQHAINELVGMGVRARQRALAKRCLNYVTDT
jgi:hypothetical protein